MMIKISQVQQQYMKTKMVFVTITWWCVWKWRIGGGGLRSLLDPSLFGGKSLAVPLKLAVGNAEKLIVLHVLHYGYMCLLFELIKIAAHAYLAVTHLVDRHFLNQ